MNMLSSHNTPKITFRRIFIIAIPVLLANLAMPIQGLVDTAIIAQMGQAASLAGLGIAVQMMTVLLASFNFLQYASSGLTAQHLGAAGLTSGILAIAWRAWLIAALIAVMLWLAQIPLVQLGLTLFSASQTASDIAKEYLGIRFLGVFADLANYVFVGVLAGMGRTRQLLLLQSTIALLNIAISILLVKFAHLGVAGVAWGTVLAQWLGVLMGLFIFAKSLGMSIKELWQINMQVFEKSKLFSLLRLNKDIFIRTILLTLSFAWLTKLGAMHGDAALSANIILLQILSLSAYALDGLAVAAETLCGQAFGQKNRSLFLLALRRTGISIMVIAALLSVGWLLAMPSYLDMMAKDPVVHAIATRHSLFASLLPIVGALAYWIDGVYFGMTAGKQIRQAAMIVAVIYFLASVILHTSFGMMGIWLSVLLLLALRFVVLACFLPSTLNTLETQDE